MACALTQLMIAATGMLAASGAAQAAERRVAIGDGAVEGVAEGKVNAFLGLPFAAPPVGANRWRAPQPAPAISGVRDASRFAASCAQPVMPQGFGPWTHEYVVQGSASEDCLYLNVWAPAGRRAHLPVMVWIHGGGFGTGSGSVPIYDGRYLAERGIIVVTINYRLGVFGFLAHPEITREAAGAAPSNFGLQDQIAALRWVKANIAAFGGDPDRVTIAGQSAGSMSVHALVVSPLAKGLFARAIAESGLPDIVPVPTLHDAERTGVAFMQEKGASTLAALRAMPADVLMAPAKNAKPGEIRFAPIVDGVLLPDDPAKLAATGSFADVPMLVGQNADEGSAMTPGYGAGAAADYRALLTRSFGASADRIAALYPGASDTERSASSKAILRDRGLGSLARWYKGRAAHGRAPVFGYVFSHVEPGPEAARYGAFHSSEIPYVLGTLDAAPERPYTAVDRSVMQTLSSYWGNFIRNGDPNGAALPRWPALSPERPLLLELGADSAPRPVLRPEVARAMDDYVAQGGRLSLF